MHLLPCMPALAAAVVHIRRHAWRLTPCQTSRRLVPPQTRMSILLPLLPCLRHCLSSLHVHMRLPSTPQITCIACVAGESRRWQGWALCCMLVCCCGAVLAGCCLAVLCCCGAMATASTMLHALWLSCCCGATGNDKHHAACALAVVLQLTRQAAVAKQPCTTMQ